MFNLFRRKFSVRNSNRPIRKPRKLRVERLEDRSLLAALLYDNGPINGAAGFANSISGGWLETDSFTLSNASVFTSAKVSLWTDSPATPVSLAWSIGTTAFGSEVASGVAGLSNTFIMSAGDGQHDIFESLFVLSGSAAAGNYWFTIHSGTATTLGLDWDVNFGPSTSFQRLAGQTYPVSGHSFQIYGETSTSDLAANTLSIDNGIVNFGWSIGGADLTVDPSVKLYWSDNNTFEVGTDAQAFSIDTTGKRAVGSYPGSVQASTLQATPKNYLLLVTDPLNVIRESDEPNATDFGANNVTAIAFSDIEMQSAQLVNGNIVQFGYQTTGNPGPFEVGLYRSTDGVTYNPADRIGNLLTVLPSLTNPQAPGTFTLPSPWTPDATKPFLIVVADPDDLISESNPNNNKASLRLPDIAMTSAQFVSATAVQFTYLTVGTPGEFIVRLYRSADTNFDPASDPFVQNQTSQFITPSPTNPQAPGIITIATPLSRNPQLRYLLVVATPINTIPESDTSNNSIVALQAALTLTSISDVDPIKPTVSFESRTRLDQVRWSLDSNVVASVGPLPSGNHNFTLPDLSQLLPGRHTLTVEGVINGVVVTRDTATLNTSSLGRQLATEHFLVYIMIEGIGVRAVQATALFTVLQWEWSLPGATVDRRITNPVLVLTSSIERDLEIVGGATLEINGTRSTYNMVPSIGNRSRWGAAFEIANFSMFVKRGTPFAIGISLAAQDSGGLVPFLNRTINAVIR